MGIGLSNGAFYRDELHHLSSQWDKNYDDNVRSPLETQTSPDIENNEIRPTDVYRGQEMDRWETDPTGVGMPVSYKPTPAVPIDSSRLTDIHSGGPAVPMPKTIANTKAGPITNEDVNTAINVGMGGGPGTIAGLNSLGSLAAESRGALLSKLGHAQVLENSGVHPDDIYTTTGFFKGPEGKWRYEIGDAAANFKGFPEAPNRGPMEQQPLFDSAKLGDILDHPELYKSYPHLKDMPVYHDPELSGAYFNPNEGSITLGGKPYQNLLGESVVAVKDKSTLMHEVQHAIQDAEGFATGGTPARAGIQLSTNPPTYVLKHQEAYKDWMNKVGPEIDRIYYKFDKGGGTKALTDEEIEFAKKYQKTKDTFQKYRQEGDIKAQENYLKLAGENEARNVQNRMDLDEVTRRNTPPRWTQDFPDKDLIVKDESAMATPYGAFTVKDLQRSYDHNSHSEWRRNR